jgi:hypothetical protein
VKDRRFRALYLAPALALIALMAWALASPVGASPDDDFHLASIWCANAAKTSDCRSTSDPSERIVPAIIHFAPCFEHKPLQSAACQQKYFDEGSRPTVTTDRGSFENNYPPVYYATMNVLVGSDIATSVVVMRLANILIFLAFVAGLYVLLPVARRPTLLWSWMLSVVPLGMFLLASNNPSSWAIVGIGSAWIALLGYFETTGRRRIGLGVVFVLATIVAAGSRGDAALYVVLSAAAVVILTFSRTRAYLLSAILPVAMAAVGVGFFLTSRQSGVVASGLASVGGVTPPSANPINLAINDAMNVPSLWSGVFGTWPLGWLDTVLPAVVPLGAMVAFIAVLFVGLSDSSARKTIAVTVVAVALLLIPTYVLVKGLNVVGENVQPRYLLPLIVLIAGLGMVTHRSRRVVLNRLQLTVVVGGLAVAESVALYTNMRRYITGSTGHGFNLNSDIGWWWSVAPSPMVVWIVGSLAFAALLVVLVREMNKVHDVQNEVPVVK